MKVIIVSGGYIDRLFLEKKIKEIEYDLLLGVDGGGLALMDIEVMPDRLIGDFDSIEPDVLNVYKNKGINIIPFPPEKDMTDTDIAIEYAINQKATDIYIFGGIGSRLDHTLGNIFILEKYIDKANLNIINKNNHIQLLKHADNYLLQGDIYKYLSLIPISDNVKNVTTKGLKYELTSYDLERKQSLGISNEILSKTATLSFDYGLMLVILSRD